MVTQVNTEVLTTGLVIPSGKYISTSSGINPVVVNKLIKDTRTSILHSRQTLRFVYKRLIGDTRITTYLKG